MNELEHPLRRQTASDGRLQACGHARWRTRKLTGSIERWGGHGRVVWLDSTPARVIAIDGGRAVALLENHPAPFSLGAPRGSSPDQGHHERLLATLRAAVAKVCPRRMASARDDIVQSAMLRVLELERRGEQNAPRTASYLWRVAFTATVDELRRLRRLEELAREGTATRESIGITGDAILAAALRRCFDQLAEPRRLAVGLHLQGFRAEESSRVLQWSVKRVRNLTYRGLENLRRCLEKRGVKP